VVRFGPNQSKLVEVPRMAQSLIECMMTVGSCSSPETGEMFRTRFQYRGEER
jgi:hypothetical protein